MLIDYDGRCDPFYPKYDVPIFLFRLTNFWLFQILFSYCTNIYIKSVLFIITYLENMSGNQIEILKPQL